MTYKHPNAAIAIPNLRPKIGQSPFTMPFTQRVQTYHRPITIVSKIVGKGPKIIEGPKIIITSIVRNEEITGSLETFLKCCGELEQYHKNIVYIFIEGDSSDKTYDVLKNWIEKRDGSILEKIDSGHPPFTKDRNLIRTAYFAELRNILIDLVLSITDANEILMIDANYGWKGDLIGSLRETGADIAAPIVTMINDNNGRHIFYDIWAFRKNGKEFGPFYPYVEGIESNYPIEIDSVGSGYLIKRRVLESGVRYNGDNDCEHVNMCLSAREKGFNIRLNPKIYIKKMIKGIVL